MGDNHSADPTQGSTATNPAQTAAEGKGKGRAEPQDVSMGEEESSSDEETGAEDEVRTPIDLLPHQEHSLHSI